MKSGDPIVNPPAAKILIVDDERDLVEMLAFALQKKEYQTIRAYDGPEAWRKIQTEKPDLIILDLMLPDLDGWEICRMIRRDERKEIRETAILMLSARALTTDRIYGLELGADDYLTKPFSLAELGIRRRKDPEEETSRFRPVQRGGSSPIQDAGAGGGFEKSHP